MVVASRSGRNLEPDGRAAPIVPVFHHEVDLLCRDGRHHQHNRTIGCRSRNQQQRARSTVSAFVIASSAPIRGYTFVLAAMCYAANNKPRRGGATAALSRLIFCGARRRVRRGRCRVARGLRALAPWRLLSSSLLGHNECSFRCKALDLGTRRALRVNRKRALANGSNAALSSSSWGGEDMHRARISPRCEGASVRQLGDERYSARPTRRERGPRGPVGPLGPKHLGIDP